MKMTVFKRTAASSALALGYGLLLVSFAALGPFVAALATGSGAAAALGIGLCICLTGSVMCFRAASQKLTQSGVFAAATSPTSIFSEPLHQDQIDRYLESYRGEPSTAAPDLTLTVLVGGASTGRSDAESSAPARLSA